MSDEGTTVTTPTFNADEFLTQMREFTTAHPEITEKFIVYIDESMKQQILDRMTEEEKAEFKLVSLAELVSEAAASETQPATGRESFEAYKDAEKLGKADG